MKISIRLLESDREIALKIANALIPDVRKYFGNVIKIIRKELPILINKAIINTPEYSSLTGGLLKYELGIPDAPQKIAGLLEIWSKNISIVYSPPVISGGGQISSKISASMIKIDFSDVLYTDYAEVYDSLRGYSLPWLQWLLLEGNRVLIKDYRVVFGSSKRSRTGFALMRTSKTQSWKVPAQFAGTESDNWITRAIDQTETEVYNLLEKALKQ